MQQDFKHYLITRFNVPVKNWEKDKAGNKVLDQEWMEHRLHLFSQYCAPTIRIQTCTNFTWLIYCDINTESHFLEQVRSAIAGMNHAEIRLADDFDGLLHDLRETILHLTTPYVISTRLDNDDGLSPDFIRNVQTHFRPQHRLILNFTKGVLYDAGHKVMTEIRRSLRNHYASLIEMVTVDTIPLTVLGYPHGIPPATTEILDLHHRWSWLKIIHDRNMASKTNGWPLFNSHIADQFKLNRKLFPISFISTLVYIMTRSLSRIKRKWLPKKVSRPE
jgi:hypothetical protein